MTILQSNTEEIAIEELHQRGCTDGLPIVLPTLEKVKTMAQRVDIDLDMVIGIMGPREGAASIEKVAAAAVMAGCLPDHFPVLVAAVKAVCDKAFDLTEVNQTTHSLAPVILVNGPASVECGNINHSFGILGPGNRASACIGRALSLALINIGGRHPGTTDMAIYSSPTKFTACFAEDESGSPFDPYHVSKGYAHEDSTVTVIGAESPHSIILEPTSHGKGDAERLILCIAGAIANPGSNHIYRGGGGGVLVVLNPEHAEILSSAGFDRRRIQHAICEKSVMEQDLAFKYYAGLNHVQEKDSADNASQLHALNNPNQVMLVVAGGRGSYSMIMPTWAYAPPWKSSSHP